MIAAHPQICLFQPEIPQNTGNIGRIAAATQCRLHLIKPFGFVPSDKKLRRAGLDYWPYLDLEIHDTLEPLLKKTKKFAFLSKKSKVSFSMIPQDCELLVFGKETSGLPEELWQNYSEHFYSIPMFHPNVRSFNLANSVAIVLFELMRKKGLLK